MASDITNIKSTLDKVINKLDAFIDKADTKYATKDELKSLKSDIRATDAEMKTEMKWSKEKIFAIAKDVAIAGALLFLMFGFKI
jgi:ElaB/YqjD/DUF883 family membrane-anchored ribosome-binding protein